jgi:hypothetical protein
MSKILIAPLEALTDSALSDPERRVLLALFSWRGKTTETVWPSLSEIGERANISDPTRISKITSSLAAKGWLTKKKKGFTGCNEYTLNFPERLENDFTNLDSDTKLDAKAKMDSDTNSNLDSDTNSNLDSDTKYKEQTIKQTIEQTNIKKTKTKKTSDELDFSVWPEHSKKLRDNWQKIPKRKAAGINQTVVDDFGEKFRQAEQNGYRTDQCLTVCITEGWRGFNWKWLQNLINREQDNGKNQQPSYHRGNQAVGLHPDDTSWADELFGKVSHASSGLDQQGVQVIEGNFSRVASSNQRP